MVTEPERFSGLLGTEILDSSALTKYAAKEADWDEVEKHITSADSLELALKETSNALWKKLLKKEVELEAVKKIVKTLGETLWFLDQRTYMDRALEIASDHKITIYDSLFLACAEMEKSKLVSCDSRQLEVARKLGIETILV